MRMLNTADKNMIKEINTKAIFKIIRDYGPISRADIAKRLKITPVTVSANVLDLLDEELVLEVGSGESKGGRRPIMLQMNPDARLVIGVDMGIEKVEVGLVNIGGDIKCSTVQSYKSNEKIMETIESLIDEIIESEDVSKDLLLGIGMGVHGIVDRKNGQSIYAPAFDWHDKDITSNLERKYQLPIVIENDARAMALCERWFGNCKDVDDFILMNIGEGIGAGIYINGELFSGFSYGAGEVGHIAVSSGDYLCECGSRGCMTTVASAKGIVNRFNAIEKKDHSGIEAKDIYALAISGDHHAQMVFKKTGEYIGKGLSILVNLFNPEKIVLTGGVSKAYELMDDIIDDVVNHQSLKHNRKDVKIVESDFVDNGGVIGAATLLIETLFVTDNFRM